MEFYIPLGKSMAIRPGTLSHTLLRAGGVPLPVLGDLSQLGARGFTTDLRDGCTYSRWVPSEQRSPDVCIISNLAVFMSELSQGWANSDSSLFL